MSRPVIAGTVTTTAALLIRAAGQAATFLILARYFSPDIYGQFVAVVCIGVLVAPTVTAGIEYSTVSLVATRRATTAECIGNGLLVLSLLAPIGVFAAVAYVATALELLMSWWAVIGILAAEIVFVPMLELSWRAFQAHDRMTMVGAVRACPAVLKLSAAVLLILGVYPASMSSWAMAYMLASILAALTSVWIATHQFGVTKTDGRACWRAVREGWPFAIYSVAERTTNDMDKLLLATLSGAGAAGIYSAAYRLVEVLVMPLMAGLMTVNATIYRVGATTPRRILPFLRKIAALIGVYGLASALAVEVSADWMVSILGRGYANSAEALRALSILPLCYGMRVLLGLGLAGVGKQSSRMLVQCAAAVMSTLLSLLLIPSYGVIGAAAATISTEIVAICILWVLLARIPDGAGTGESAPV